MPWKEYTVTTQRGEFVRRVREGDGTVSALCRAFGISRKTGYKWLEREQLQGVAGLEDRSRRPRRSPRQTPEVMERLICELRAEHPAWGGRKLHHRLKGDGVAAVPAPSTITGILRRHGLLSADRRLKRDWQRFEAAEPNELWQMDFKGHFATGRGRCHPLTLLDDHSRFNLCLSACTDQQATTVQEELSRVFRCYGLPRRMLMDNGSPWGSDLAHPHTRLTAWLMRQGITVLHGRPRHPQTQGKEERFHGTLARELLTPHSWWQDLAEVQTAFDRWRSVYNDRRPHEALGYAVPASRYTPSHRAFPVTLPPIAYESTDEVRKVQQKGIIHFRGREFHIGKGFVGEPVALREVGDGLWNVYYCHQRVAQIDLITSRPAGREV